MKLYRWLSTMTLILAIGVMSPGIGVAEPAGMDLDEGMDTLSRQLMESVSRGTVRTVAVADFRDSEGGVSGLGRQVARELVTRLSDSGKVQVVVSGEVERLVDELKLNQTDLFDHATTPKMGKMVGADMILAGTVTDMGSLVRINGQLIDTERRRILGAGAVSVAKGEHVSKLLALRIGGVPHSSEQPVVTGWQNINEREQPREERFTVFENDYVRVTVRSIQRLRSSVVLEVWYENLMDYPATLASDRWGSAYATDHRGTYLVADTGEKWMYKEDTQVGNHYGGIELLPRQRLMNRITFTPEDRGTGSRFTYAGNYQFKWQEGPRQKRQKENFQVILRDLAAMTEEKVRWNE